MKNILVTGAAGFIGSHLVDALLDEEWNVTAVDNFDNFYPESLKWANIAGHLTHPNYRLLQLDIANLENLRKYCEHDYDAVAHLAAKAGVRESILHPCEYQRVNLLGTQNVLELARYCNAKQFIFASSSSVYGTNPNVPWLEEDNALLPISPYASSKASAELTGRVYSHLYGIRFVALRFFTVYGPRQRPDLAINKFASRIYLGKPVEIYGDGTSERDYTFVGDVVDAAMAATRYYGKKFEIFNIGNSKTIKVRELINTIGEVLGKDPIIEYLPAQPGDVTLTWASIKKATTELGYNPKITLVEGIMQFADWANLLPAGNRFLQRSA